MLYPVIEVLILLLILALATASISMTLTKAKFFKAPRDWIKTRAKEAARIVKELEAKIAEEREVETAAEISPGERTPKPKKVRAKILGLFAELVSCPYCMSHWWAAAGVIYCRPLIFGGRIAVVVDLVISTFAVITLSSFACGLIFKAFAQMEPNGEEENGEAV